MKRARNRILPIALITAFMITGIGGLHLAWSDEQDVPPVPRLSIHKEKDKNGVEGYELSAYIQGDAKAIFDIIADTANVHQIFPDVRAKLIKKEKTGDKDITKILWHYTIQTPLGEKELDLWVTDNYKTLKLEWKRQSGYMVAFEGYGSVTTCKEHPGWAKLEYNHFQDAGGLAPQFMTNSINKRGLLALVPNIEKVLEEQKKKPAK